MTKIDHEDFKNFTKCWICMNAYEEREGKVKNYDHITDKYQGSTHQKCNLNLSLSKKIYVVIHNFQNFLFFKKLENIISK